MSIIENAERYMKRYDYLMEKRERRYAQGKRLSQEEDEELRQLRPNVFTPILVMFELLHETVKTNQTIRKSNPTKHKHKQSGGAPKTDPAAAAAAAAATAAAVAAIATTSAGAVPPGAPKTDPAAAGDKKTEAGEGEDEEDDADAKEAQRLSELEESLMPLLTKIIVYIEQNKDKDKKKKEEDEEEKYPDIGTSAKNSAILVIRRIKKWWNDLIAGGSSDLSSKINLKKAIPQLPNNQDDQNKIIEKATTIVEDPLKKIEKLLANDVRDIASSSVEGIMNALSLIPGIGTTLQLWRLLQNVIVIMSKSVTTMAGAKKEGVALKEGIQEIKGDLEAAGKGAAEDAAKSAVAGAVPGGLPTPTPPGMPAPPTPPAVATPTPPGAPTPPAVATPPAAPTPPAVATPPAAAPPPAAAGGGDAAAQTPPAAGGDAPPPAAAPPAAAGGGAGGAGGGMGGGMGGGGRKPNHLRSIKKYKREYKQSVRDIRKTRKKMMKYIRNII
jgi:hypothetical protein